MISTRINQTMIATKTGTALVRVALLIRLLPTTMWSITATELPRHFRQAFMTAASSQVPNRYQTSAGWSLFVKEYIKMLWLRLSLSQSITVMFGYEEIYWLNSGFMLVYRAMVFPVGSLNMPNQPVSGISIFSCTMVPPSSAAFLRSASISSLFT